MDIRLNDFAKIDHSINNSRDIVFYDKNELAPDSGNYDNRKDFHEGVNVGKVGRWGTSTAAVRRNEVTWNKLRTALENSRINGGNQVDTFLENCGLKGRMDAHKSLRSRDVKVVMNNVFAERFDDIMDSLSETFKKSDIDVKKRAAILSAFKCYFAGIMNKREVAAGNKERFAGILNDLKIEKKNVESVTKEIKKAEKTIQKNYGNDLNKYTADDLDDSFDEDSIDEYETYYDNIHSEDSNGDIDKLHTLVEKVEISKKTDEILSKLNKLDARTVINQLATCNKEDIAHKCLEFLQKADVIEDVMNFEINDISADVDEKIKEADDFGGKFDIIFTDYLQKFPSFKLTERDSCKKIFTTLLKSAQLFSKYSNKELLKTEEGKAKLREVMMKFSETIKDKIILYTDKNFLTTYSTHTETQRWQDLLAIAKMYKTNIDNQISLEFFEIMAVESLGLDTMGTTLEENQVILKQTSKEKSERFETLSLIAKDFMKELTAPNEKRLRDNSVEIISRNNKLFEKDGEIMIQSKIKVKEGETVTERVKGTKGDNKIGADLKNILKNMGYKCITLGKENKSKCDVKIVNDVVDYCNGGFKRKFSGKEHKAFDKLDLGADYSNYVDKQKRLTEIKSYLSFLKRGNDMTVNYKQGDEYKTKDISSYDMTKRGMNDDQKISEFYKELMEAFNNNETMVLAVCYYINELTPDVQIGLSETVNKESNPLKALINGQETVERIIQANYLSFDASTDMKDSITMTVDENGSVTIERTQKRRIDTALSMDDNYGNQQSIDELKNAVRTFHTKVTLKSDKISEEGKGEVPCVTLTADTMESVIRLPEEGDLQ